MVTTYSISQYGSMIADRLRVDAYAQALRRSVGPESVVLDIGTGTGIFALLACKYGARRVYAVDPSDSIELARRIAARNGMADRIIFLQDVSTQIELPERADVVVSNITGVLPYFESHLPSIIDARSRLLKPGGVLIPQQDRLYAAVVKAPTAYSRLVSPWSRNRYGFDLSLGRDIVANSWVKQRVRPEHLVTRPALCATIDYASVEATGFSARLEWVARWPGIAHAISLWFDSTTAPGVELSNSPTAPELIFGAAFLPLRRPVSLCAGDRIQLELRADLIAGDYVWTWETQVSGGAAEDPRNIASFAQSTALGETALPARVLRSAADYRPARSRDGDLELAVLQWMQGERSIEEIAARLLAEFPGRFQGGRDAMVFVGEISARLSR
jgi:protein arginine N-methyltransferase 1